MKKLYMLFIALVPVFVWGQVLSWNFTGAAGNETAITVSSKDANLLSSDLTRGAGVTATGLANAFSSSGWNVDSKASAISGNKYYQFTVAAAAGYQSALSTLDAWFRRSSTGPNAFQWQYSLDGFASAGVDVGAAIAYSGTTTGGDQQLQINLSAVTALQNVAAGTTISFRLYGWGATGAGGTFALGRPTSASLFVGGTVSQLAGASPLIVVSPATLSGFSTVAGTASAAQTITASGSNLTADITVTPSGPYEISADGTTYSSSPLTLTQAGGTVANSSISIRIAAAAAAGTASGSVSLSSAGAATQVVSLSGTVGSGIVPALPASFTATTVSASQINLSGSSNAAGDNIIVASNATNTFGTPTGTLVAGNNINGGGTVVFNGPASAFPFSHTGLTPGLTYFYKAWSVDGSNNYSADGLSASATTTAAATANVVINQVYGGGGNSGATYKNDFIELYNNENNPVNLAGWSLQYTSAAGTGTWQVHALTGTIPAHSFFLVQEAAGSAGTVNLPAPDATGTLALSGTAGKILLSNTVTAQTGANPAGAAIMDKVGYGAAATGFEGSPAPGTDNSTAIIRTADGVDNNNNATDFALGAPIPRNSGYTTTAPGIASLTPPNGTTNLPYNIKPAIVFDKKIVKGTGSIMVYQDAILDTTIDVNDAAVVIGNNNTVAIPAVLQAGKSYHILVSAGAFKDVYNNNFAGITGNSDWAFTTYNTDNSVGIPVTFDFQACTGNGLLPDGFTQYSVNGTAVWDCTAFGRDPATPSGTAPFPNGVQINGYDNALGNVLNTDWLITPALNLTGTTYPLLQFYSRTRFNGAPLQLKVSTNYTGTGDPNLATWTDLNGKFPQQTTDTWTASVNINLAAFKQSKVYVAFVYTSTNDDGARWTLDDISLINSMTPPPPSLTLSTNSIDFFYAAMGTTVTKQFTVIGNDLSGGQGINIAATGSFEVSADNASFGSSVNLPEASANNTSSTVYVRFAPALSNQNFNGTVTVGTFGVADTVISLTGTSIDPAKTLEVVNWNMEWFGSPDPTLGPTNKAQQKQNAQIILPSIGADLFALVEVVDTAALGDIVRTSMPGYNYVICNYGSHGNPFETGASPMNQLQKEAFVYKTSVFTNIDTTSLLSAGINTAADLSNPAYNYWSSGRYPFMMTADVTLNGVTKKIHFVAVHAKANTSPTVTAYNRRKSGADSLYTYLNTNYPNDNIVILGDFNDDLDSTITDGISPRLSSYKTFTDDAANYYSPTLVGLSLTGKKSTVAYNDVIDHVIVSNEMKPYFMNASAAVLSDVTSLVTNYGSTTSDHYPVFTRYAFDAALLPVRLVSFTASRDGNTVKLQWKSAEETNSSRYEVQRAADGINFSTIGTVSATGMAADYRVVDASPLAGDNYYRLKPIDKDGKFVYSKVVKLNFGRLPGIHISPNPASSYIYVSLENISSTVTLQIIDGNGKLLQQQTISQGTATKTISLSGLSRGLYTVKMISQEKVDTRKLLVQ